MKKVLVIAYHYPPLGGGGVFRTLKFTKYLPRFGFKPYVLTVKNSMYSVRDPTLLDDIPPEVEIFRTFSLEHRRFQLPFSVLRIPSKWVFVPDMNLGWLPFALWRGERIIKKQKVDVIYATAPIYTTLLIGCLLKRKTGKPLVIDFRDPWTQNVFIKYPTSFHKHIEEEMERFVLKIADHIITATEPMRLKLIEKYPFIRGKCTTITNGFDSEDFEGLTKSTRREKFTITFTGYLYGLRTGKHFITALKELIREEEEIKSKIQVVFAGPPNKQTIDLVNKLGLQSIVRFMGYVSHQEILKLMVDSDCLLLIIALEEPYSYTGKLFEYLGAKRPILALAPLQGVAADLIRSTKTGIIVSPGDINSIKQGISKLYKEWKKGDLVIQGNVSEFDRKVLTEKLTKVFQQVTSKPEQ